MTLSLISHKEQELLVHSSAFGSCVIPCDMISEPFSSVWAVNTVSFCFIYLRHSWSLWCSRMFYGAEIIWETDFGLIIQSSSISLHYKVNLKCLSSTVVRSKCSVLLGSPATSVFDFCGTKTKQTSWHYPRGITRTHRVHFTDEPLLHSQLVQWLVIELYIELKGFLVQSALYLYMFNRKCELLMNAGSINRSWIWSGWHSNTACPEGKRKCCILIMWPRC